MNYIRYLLKLNDDFLIKKYNIIYNYFIDKIHAINREEMVNISERIREIYKERKIPHWKLAEKARITGYNAKPNRNKLELI